MRDEWAKEMSGSQKGGGRAAYNRAVAALCAAEEEATIP
jgi:hypothetical protein